VPDPPGPIQWKLHLRAPVEAVYHALTTDEGRASFWAASGEEKQDVIEFRFINGVSHRSRVLEKTSPRLFALEYFGGVARFELEPDGTAATELTLTHSGVPAEEWLETYAGWLNVLLVLKAAVVFGVDLRNHDPRRSWKQGYVDQ
jgi:hypothetical protein